MKTFPSELGLLEAAASDFLISWDGGPSLASQSQEEAQTPAITQQLAFSEPVYASWKIKVLVILLNYYSLYFLFYCKKNMFLYDIIKTTGQYANVKKIIIFAYCYQTPFLQS